ncbi:2Fe-2S iron-sulfur cluster-binding protein [Streptomyces jeddahensis]|uniref:Nicotinate dehydrogenase small FeS subunit n=1 Tax=Streptomyces jeddahensis TaxID=1716141 RepID=A0A177HWY6_9ACTN|nr:2Fe-2S iron-sulfur cluster-binding protein [Streptomyces jeddahensis]OAH15119.1 nicotinate dehydrogenase small FeS subunit [Streptomyces jeddahensis]
MTDHHDDQGNGGPTGVPGAWEPLPQGEYDSDATAFVTLPEGGIDGYTGSPLAAPGHGFVPPPITVAPAAGGATDPAATGTWLMPGAVQGGAGHAQTDATGHVQTSQWPESDAGAGVGTGAAAAADHAPQAAQDPYGAQHLYGSQDSYGGQDSYGAQDPHAVIREPFSYDHGMTGQWSFAEPEEAQAGSGSSDVTGQWSIPVAEGDLPDESGEFTTSALASQWGGTPPATLPGGAPAPWATGADAGQSWSGRAEAGDHTLAALHPGHPAESEQGFTSTDFGGAGAGHPETGMPAAVAEPTGDESPVVSREATPEAAPQASADSSAPEPSASDAAHSDHTHAAGHTAPAEHATSAEHAAAAEHAASADDAVAASRGVHAPSDPVASGDPSEAADASADHEPAADPANADPANADFADADSAEDAPQARPGGPADGAEAEAPPAPHDEHPLASYVLRVNGTDRPVADAWIGESLLYVLRERLGLAGAKDGCAQGECGACNVQVDGRLVASCLVPAATAAGSEVRTVEGLAGDGQPSDVQRALARCGAVQCGFCVPGMAMTVHDLLEGNPAPSERETRQALCGNLCRCSGYRGVLDAVREVVAERQASAEAAEAEAEAQAEADTEADAEAAAGSAEVRIPHQAGPGAGGVNAAAHEAQAAYDDQAQGQYDDRAPGPYDDQDGGTA